MTEDRSETDPDVDARRERNRRALGDLFDAMRLLDVSALRARLLPSAVIDFPFSRDVPPVTGEQLDRLVGAIYSGFTSMDVKLEEVLELADPDAFVVRYATRAETPDPALVYENRYLGIFRFQDGLLEHWTEYADPAVFEEFTRNRPAASEG